jgi:all-trans-8'-apo-beta-carotenal 15,15'-oxygenase
MDRRHLLHAAAGTALSALAAHATAKPANAADAAARFDREPLLTALRGVNDTTGQRDAQALVRGRWPAELRGRFYRNGPALFERGGERYHHWFDGDGMVQQFTIDAGRVSHRGRLVRTQKLAFEQAEGRLRMGAFGTHIDGAPQGGPDAYNTANTNALEHAGRVLALWEGGSAYALDPKDMSTQGPVTWRPDLAQVPFSAHPKIDAQGHLWNIGTFGRQIVVWHIDAQGKLVSVQVGESPFPGGMAHDMAITERHIVLPLPPVRLAFGQASTGPRRFEMAPGEPLRVLVMDKADISKRRVFELPAQMVFHVGNAWDTADGQVMFSCVTSPDLWFLNEGAVSLMQARPAATQGADARLLLLALDMKTGRLSQQQQTGDVEFPRVDPRRIGQRTRFLALGAGWPQHAGRDRFPLLHGVQITDTETGRVRRFDYGAMWVAEEHVLIPKPGKSGELDAWLLGTAFDARRQATVLNLLDAAHLEDGPVAQAVLPYALPLGFHGNFTAA